MTVMRPAAIIAYTPQAMKHGPMWWWIMPFAPGVPERLVVGNEPAFLSWFFEGAAAKSETIEPAAVDECLRTFSGQEGVLGARASTAPPSPASSGPSR